MNKKQKKTLEDIFKQPVQANIAWKDIENLFIAVDCEISEGSGSRVRVKKNNCRAVFHRPHPKPMTDKGAVVSVRKFLINIGIKP